MASIVLMAGVFYGVVSAPPELGEWGDVQKYQGRTPEQWADTLLAASTHSGQKAASQALENFARSGVNAATRKALVDALMRVVQDVHLRSDSVPADVFAALRVLRATESVNVLAKVGKDHRLRESIRYSALWHVKKLGDPDKETIKTLRSIVERRRWPSRIREQAIAALGKHDEAWLRRYAKRDRRYQIRRAIDQALK